MTTPIKPPNLTCSLIAIWVLISLSGCTDQPPRQVRRQAPLDTNLTALFFQYIYTGDSVYAQKSSYQSFANSLVYYDSARALADRSGDTLLLAEALFAKGRVYDAWNKDPQQTIRLFQQAANLFKGLPAKYERYLYVEHLVAHAYDKIKDSTHAVGVLQRMYAELSKKDTATLHRLPFTAEMALISTEVRNYQLADQILRRLTRRQWIKNNPETYDYLDHYYLTQSRLDVFYRKPAHSYYLDSLEQVYRRSKNLLDKIYYSDILSALYAATGRYREGYRYLTLSKGLSESLNNGNDINSLQSALLRSELQAQQRELAFEASLRRNRQVTIWLLGGLLLVITLLSAYLYQRNRKYQYQSTQLDRKVQLVELLNKEIQHRVKNNLYMIYSLLQMQERKTDDPGIVDALQITRLRVESIAALHDQLAQNQESLDFTRFAQGLVTSVVSCLSDDKLVRTDITGGMVPIPMKSCFALSLILNEWITNSIKYALTGQEPLLITMAVTNEPTAVRISYYDNGIVSESRTPSKGLGTQIVALLSKQLNARLITRPDQPYHFQLFIPYEQ